jgi:hypothetical protein
VNNIVHDYISYMSIKRNTKAERAEKIRVIEEAITCETWTPEQAEVLRRHVAVLVCNRSRSLDKDETVRLTDVIKSIRTKLFAQGYIKRPRALNADTNNCKSYVVHTETKSKNYAETKLADYKYVHHNNVMEILESERELSKEDHKLLKSYYSNLSSWINKLEAHGNPDISPWYEERARIGKRIGMNTKAFRPVVFEKDICEQIKNEWREWLKQNPDRKPVKQKKLRVKAEKVDKIKEPKEYDYSSNRFRIPIREVVNCLMSLREEHERDLGEAFVKSRKYGKMGPQNSTETNFNALVALLRVRHELGLAEIRRRRS